MQLIPFLAGAFQIVASLNLKMGTTFVKGNEFSAVIPLLSEVEGSGIGAKATI